MSRSISFFLRVAAVIVIIGVSLTGQSQESVVPRRTHSLPQASDAWLGQGRHAVTGNSAELLHEALRQRDALRQRNLAGTTQQTTVHPNVASTLKWTQLGPAPVNDPNYGAVAGRASAVAVDQTDTSGNTVYVGGAFGGLWRSTNAAATDPGDVVWTQLLDTQPTMAVGAVALKPDNGKVILVGTGNTDAANDAYYGLGILRSDDGGASWTQVSDAAPASGTTRISFKGVGFSKVAFSSQNPNLVVAAASISLKSAGLTTCTGCTPGWGLYYSTDAGKTWTAGKFSDGTTPPGNATGVNTVVYNPVDKLFYAAVSYHGIYSSSDGITWTRLPIQPLGGAMDINTCPSSGSVDCPIYRAELAVRPGTANELYVWIVDVTSVDQGLFLTRDGGASWTQVDEAGITNCGDSSGCGAAPGLYNLTLAAVPNGDGTDLYAGAANIYKCSVSAQNPTCTVAPFKNLTHVYGCSPKAAPAHVHPAQHGIAFSTGHPNFIFFANDGGIYRTLDGAGLSSGDCAVANPFDNLNSTMGSMAQLVSFSQDPTDQTVLLAGTPTNGTISTNSIVDKGANGLGWAVYSPGAGVFGASQHTAINPANTDEWFVSAPDSTAGSLPAVAISRCAQAINCQGQFTKVIDSTTYGGDSVGFYATPFMLDPQAPDNMILGTCRVWRGPSNPTASWGTAASPNFTTGDATQCHTATHRMLSALAAGGPSVTGFGSQVIYAGDEQGHVYVTKNADASPATWNDTTPLTAGKPKWGVFPISSIAIAASDATGATAYAAVQGFNAGAGHVFKTTDFGATWADISGAASGGIPDVPANAVIVDPAQASVVYVGTDIGVYTTSDNGAHWSEYGPTTGPGQLPTVPVTKLEAYDAGGVHKLRASTYGRGMWQIDLASFQDFTQSINPSTTKVPLGGTTTFAVTYTPTGAFAGDIAVTCTLADGSALPTGLTCTPNPTTVTTGTSSQVTVTTDATKITAAVSYDLKITGTSGSLVKSQTVTVNLTDYAISVPADKSSQTVKAGSSASYPIDITTASGHTGALTFTCTGLPDKAGCTFTPTTASPGSTVTLTIGTTAATTASLTEPRFGNTAPMFAVWLGLPGLVLAGTGIRSRRRRAVLLMLIVLAAVIVSLVGMAGCGGGSKSNSSSGSPGTPAGTYPVTVTGKSGSLSKTTTVTLIVQ